MRYFLANKRNKIHGGIMRKSGLLIFTIFVVVSLFGFSCNAFKGSEGKKEGKGVAKHDDHGHDDHGDHGKGEHAGGHEEGGEVASPEENCEHGIPIITCDECRYEIGAVKISEELLRKGFNKILKFKEVQKGTFTKEIKTPAVVDFNKEKSNRIVLKVSGILKNIQKKLGDDVQKGEVIAYLDSVEITESVSELKKVSLRFQMEKKNFIRAKKLAKSGLMSNKEYLSIKNTYQSLKVKLQEIKERLYVLGFRKSDIKKILANKNGVSLRMLPVYSPISGKIVEQFFFEGEYVEKGENIFTISDTSSFWVWASVYESDVKYFLGKNSAFEIKGELFIPELGERFPVSLDYVSPVLDNETRTLKIRFKVENRENKLLVNMYGSLKITVFSKDKSIIVPKSAILNDGNDRFVFKRYKDDIFIRADVKVGFENNEYSEIVEGVKEGDEIVVNGGFILKSEIFKYKMGAGCAD